MFHGLPVLLTDALHNVRHLAFDLLLDAFNTFFLLCGHVQTVVERVGAATINFDELLRLKKDVFWNEAAAGGEVLLGSFVVLLKIVTVGHTPVVKVPVPRHELRPPLCGMPCQHCAAEVREDAVVSLQALRLELRRVFHHRHVFRGDLGCVDDPFQFRLCAKGVYQVPTV